MKYFFQLMFFLFFVSCGYPDIDTVPDFENLIITKEESIDLCNLSSNDKKELEKCLNNLENE